MRVIRKTLSLVTALFALSSCTKADLLNLFIPNDGYTIHKDIAYGNEPRNTLDIYVPDKPDANHTVIVFFYGGAWQKGYKELYKFVGQAFTSKGYTVVVADYRLYPDVYFPAFVEDAAASVSWVHTHIGEYGGDPSHIYLAGHSAGAHIAMMITLDKQYMKAAGGDADWIKGVIGIAGPYDFLPIIDPKIKALFSSAPDQNNTQPIHFVRTHAPPVLLITADEDDQVGGHNSRNLAAKLREYHNSVQEHHYPNVGHIGVVLSLAYGFRGKAPTLEDSDTFIRSVNGSLKAIATTSR